jgi:hypothetical protein
MLTPGLDTERIDTTIPAKEHEDVKKRHGFSILGR